jgi:hypothetical protein
MLFFKARYGFDFLMLTFFSLFKIINLILHVGTKRNPICENKDF